MEKKQNILKNLYKNTQLKTLSSLKEERTQKLTTIILTLIGISILGVFAISPTLSTIAQLRRQLADNQLVEQKLTEKITSLSLLQQQYNNLRNDIPIILSAIPQAPKVPILIAQIQAIAQISNVKLVSLYTSEVELSKTLIPNRGQESPNNYSSFAFSLDATGSYENISNFIFYLANFERIITIDSLYLSKGSESVRVGLRGKAYFKG